MGTGRRRGGGALDQLHRQRRGLAAAVGAHRDVARPGGGRGHVQRLLRADAYLTKPINVRELPRLLDEAVEDR